MSFKDYFINKVKEKHLWDYVGSFIRKKYIYPDDHYLEDCDKCKELIYDITKKFENCLHYGCEKCKNHFESCSLCGDKINHVCYNILVCDICKKIQCERCYTYRSTNLYILKNNITIFNCEFCGGLYCSICSKIYHRYSPDSIPNYLHSCCKNCI
jgi:hypothetical protein